MYKVITMMSKSFEVNVEVINTKFNWSKKVARNEPMKCMNESHIIHPTSGLFDWRLGLIYFYVLSQSGRDIVLPLFVCPSHSG